MEICGEVHTCTLLVFYQILLFFAMAHYYCHHSEQEKNINVHNCFSCFSMGKTTFKKNQYNTEEKNQYIKV